MPEPKLGVRVLPQQGRRAVVAGQRVRVADEDRVPLGGRELHVEVAAEVEPQLGAGVLQAVEGGRDQAVALQVAVVLALELGDLADLQIDPAPRRQSRGLGLDAEADPRLVHVHLLVAGGGVAVVEVDEVDLAVGRQAVAPDRVHEQGHVRDLEVGAGVDRLLEPHALADREHRRLEPETTGKRFSSLFRKFALASRPNDSRGFRPPSSSTGASSFGSWAARARGLYKPAPSSSRTHHPLRDFHSAICTDLPKTLRNRLVA